MQSVDDLLMASFRTAVSRSVSGAKNGGLERLTTGGVAKYAAAPLLKASMMGSHFTHEAK